VDRLHTEIAIREVGKKTVRSVIVGVVGETIVGFGRVELAVEKPLAWLS